MIGHIQKRFRSQVPFIPPITYLEELSPHVYGSTYASSGIARHVQTGEGIVRFYFNSEKQYRKSWTDSRERPHHQFMTPDEIAAFKAAIKEQIGKDATLGTKMKAVPHLNGLYRVLFPEEVGQHSPAQQKIKKN